MAERINQLRTLPFETYNRYFDQRVMEKGDDRLRIDAFYAAMLRVNFPKPYTLILPTLVTGILPAGASKRVVARMPDRSSTPVDTRVEVYDGIFQEFEDNHILAPANEFGPLVTEGYFLKHPSIDAQQTELRELLGLHLG